MADQIKGKTKNAAEKGAGKLVKKGAKKLIEKIGFKFLINLIPIVGPILASSIVFVGKELKGDMTTPSGFFALILMAPICDLISFIPFAGPVISNGILAVWLHFRGSASESQEPQNAENTGKEEDEQQSTSDTLKMPEKKPTPENASKKPAPPPKKTT